MDRTALHRMIWRWHFYAGLLVMPFVLVLALSGAAYLFKPQIDRWEERGFRGGLVTGQVGAEAQVQAALAAWPGSRFNAYRLPLAPGDAAMVHLELPDGALRDAFVSPQGSVLGSFDPAARITPTLARIHGSLLLGRVGGWLVELAASWAIVLILTGLYLWWPAGRGWGGVVWPRIHLGRRTAWRDCHAVTGFWVAGLALVLLVTGLPWTGVWGQAFRLARTEAGLVKGAPNWKVGRAVAVPPTNPPVDPTAAHDHRAMMMGPSPALTASAGLDRFVPLARRERMAFPVLVRPPHAARPFGPPTGAVWTAASETQDRPLVRSVSYDPFSAAVVGRERFADQHPIDRAVNYGIAWHEGQLLGPFNQLIGVLTALMLITLTVTGFVMWQRRRPAGALGAPSPLAPAQAGGITAIVLVLAALLPLLAASLLTVCLAESALRLVWPGAARWLGLKPAAPRVGQG